MTVFIFLAPSPHQFRIHSFDILFVSLAYGRCTGSHRQTRFQLANSELFFVGIECSVTGYLRISVAHCPALSRPIICEITEHVLDFWESPCKNLGL